MKWLTILTFSLAVAFLSPPLACSQELSVSAGIYDFTDITTREFYLMAPTLSAGADVWKRTRLSVHLATGLSFTSVKYNSHRHYFYMVPLTATFNYDLLDPGSKVCPVIGMGFRIAGKADRNSDFDRTHYSLTYGYVATGGIHWRPGKKIILSFDLSYNLMMPPVTDELNLSGVSVLLGARFPLRSPEKKP